MLARNDLGLNAYRIACQKEKERTKIDEELVGPGTLVHPFSLSQAPACTLRAGPT